MELACSLETSKHIYYPKQCKNLETTISPLQTAIHTVNFTNDNWERTGIIDCSEYLYIIIEINLE